MSASRVLLTALSVRRSGKGREYLSGWLGKASVVAFAGEPDKFGNPTWDVFVCQPEQRQSPAAADPSPRTGDAARPAALAATRTAQNDDRPSGRTMRPAGAAARPGASYGAEHPTIHTKQREHD